MAWPPPSCSGNRRPLPPGAMKSSETSWRRPPWACEGIMEFSYSSEQTAFQDSIRRFCRSNYSFKARQELLASEEGFSREHWKFFAEQGWLAAVLPEDVGGLGGSAVDASIVL